MRCLVVDEQTNMMHECCMKRDDSNMMYDECCCIVDILAAHLNLGMALSALGRQGEAERVCRN